MHDVAVIGGGPGGSTAANLLARAGRDVALFEKDRFPRFHIGESLLPHNMRIFERLGIVPALRERFIEKWGAEFVSSTGEHSYVYHFEKAIVPTYPMCFEVVRSEFDRLLLDEAAARGVAVNAGAKVVEADQNGDKSWRLTVEEEGGSRRMVDARFLIDASGREGFLPRKLKLREMSSTHRKAAVFAHYRNVPRREGKDAGNIVVILMSDGWIWFIPFADGTTSVGVVADGSRIRELGLSPEQTLDRAVADCPGARERLERAERISEVRGASDWTFVCKRFAGDGYMLVGDAGAFLDPVWSSGVFLAMTAGEVAADLLADRLGSNKLSRRDLIPYERKMLGHLDTFQRMITAFYSPVFPRLLFFPDRKVGMTEAVINLLAGDIHPAWKVRWRLELFFLVARMHGRFDLGRKVQLHRLFDPELATRTPGSVPATADAR
jgi:flavin-dependent dehydrogenase